MVSDGARLLTGAGGSGALREWIGLGTLLDGAHLLFGEAARDWRVQIMPDSYPGVLIAILPPGAFILLAF